MTIEEAIRGRHSVRQYQNKKLDGDAVTRLEEEIQAVNKEGGLHVQLVLDEPKAFEGGMAKYGSFRGVTNYIAMIGRKSSDLDEKCGYYGERLVLLAQQLGLNTCWVGLTFKKIPGVMDIRPDEKLVIVISIGYGRNQGVPHKSKGAAAVSNLSENSPEWFQSGMEYALLAPTAVNQQKFTLTQSGNKVTAKAGMGFFARVDLGIVKYHFELGAGKENFSWE